MARSFAIVMALCAAAHSQNYHELPTGDGQVYYLQKNQNPLVDSLDRIFQYSPLPARLPVNGFGFSNPPPPLGVGVDLSGLTCGLAPPVCPKARYRSIDGSCNNIQRPAWGMAQGPYGRLLPFNYADGISAWPVSSTGQQLPNPRTISLALFPDKNLVDPVWNLNAQQWGQIITHDMSLTAGVTQTHKEPVTCCNDNGQLVQDAVTNPQCRPILIPPGDPVHAPYGTQCMNFVRTASTRDRGCTPPAAPAVPLSVVTAYMDLSQVYGSSVGQASPLREYQEGRMLTVLREGREWPPQDPNVTVTCESAQSPLEPCYLAGDIRMNQNPQLTVLQIILLREHNRLADALTHLNPHWGDETVFQEARRINIAQYQHINYYEYLPIFLGAENMIKNKLIYPGVHGYVNDYNPNVDPAVLDEHATAAFRHFHTLIRGFLQLISENRQLLGAVRMSDWFNRPLLLEIGTTFEDLARGLTTQQMDFSDQFWSTEMTQFLFKRNNTVGGDLRATDIQRGRDHGLANYVTTRGACGLPVPKSFADMTDFISQENVKVLQHLYATPEDVDLVVAGSLENNVPGAQAGPTFLCILTEQFYRTRVADRFFYENGADPDTAFTPDQLEAIRRGASMARVLCDNADGIHIMQPKAFEQIKSGNHLVPCEHLPAVDLSPWKDATGTFK
ncbi:peroxidase isoform X2 [Choristoneura fumiferana]|uniref:peroxidase isoform X2 n=1 Tax=Choristoneura fumiferana TaxID=7141 RepID=UPI003D153EC5